MEQGGSIGELKSEHEGTAGEHKQAEGEHERAAGKQIEIKSE